MKGVTLKEGLYDYLDFNLKSSTCFTFLNIKAAIPTHIIKVTTYSPTNRTTSPLPCRLEYNFLRPTKSR